MISIRVEDLGQDLEVTVRHLKLFGSFDEVLLRNAVDACGGWVWFGNDELVLAISKGLADAQFSRLAEILQRFGFSKAVLRRFLQRKYVDERRAASGIKTRPYRGPQNLVVIDKGSHQEIQTDQPLGHFGMFDQRLFFDALFYCGIDSAFHGNRLILKVNVPKIMPEWQAKRVAGVLLRFNFSLVCLRKLDGIKVVLKSVHSLSK